MIEFKQSDLDKRDRIVNAALKEFSENSFEKASTNNIVKSANVSKGLLYHYFKSKDELYTYLKDFVFITILDAIKKNIDWEKSDFFERLLEVTMIKINITKVYPQIYDFSMRLIRDTSIQEMRKLAEEYSLDLLQKVYSENIDFTLFKEGIDMAKAMQIIQWTFEKYSEDLSKRPVINYEAIFDEVNEYMIMLKLAFYK